MGCEEVSSAFGVPEEFVLSLLELLRPFDPRGVEIGLVELYQPTVYGWLLSELFSLIFFSRSTG